METLLGDKGHLMSRGSAGCTKPRTGEENDPTEVRGRRKRPFKFYYRFGFVAAKTPTKHDSSREQLLETFAEGS